MSEEMFSGSPQWDTIFREAIALLTEVQTLGEDCACPFCKGGGMGEIGHENGCRLAEFLKKYA